MTSEGNNEEGLQNGKWGVNREDLRGRDRYCHETGRFNVPYWFCDRAEALGLFPESRRRNGRRAEQHARYTGDRGGVNASTAGHIARQATFVTKKSKIPLTADISSDPVSEVYRLTQPIAEEVFGERILVMQIQDHRTFELNLAGLFILTHTDGRHSVGEIASTLARTFGLSRTKALEDTISLCNQLQLTGFLTSCDCQTGDINVRKKGEIALVRYARNPDVVLREENENGVLLFNPHTARVKVLNCTAAFVWWLYDSKHDIYDIVTIMYEKIVDVPHENVFDDVLELTQSLRDSGFII